MSMPNQKGWLAILGVVFILGIPFALVYYISSDTYNARYKNWYQQSQDAHLPARSTVAGDKILLVKDEKVVIDRTCLVFKTADDNKICLDLFLLDLDPEQTYPLCMIKTDPEKEFQAGNIRYRILSVNNRVLRLKIVDQYQTP